MDVCYILDASCSMAPWGNRPEELVNAAVTKLSEKDKISVLSFDGRSVTLLKDKVSKDGFKLSGFDAIGAGTNLWDAVLKGIEQLDKRTKTPKLLVVVTDGENNCGKASADDVREASDKKLATDRWTFAYMCPPSSVQTLKRHGVLEGNICPWTNINQAIQALDSGTQAMTSAVAAGATRSANFFQTNLQGQKKADIRAAGILVKGIKRAQVTKREPINSFCQKNFKEFIKGRAYYELTKTEIVQSYKDIAVIDKRRPNEVFAGGRDVLGFPAGEVKVKPGDHGNYRIFVQSTSVNRATDVGTEVLYI